MNLCPDAIVLRSLCINGDIGEILDDLIKM